MPSLPIASSVKEGLRVILKLTLHSLCTKTYTDSNLWCYILITYKKNTPDKKPLDRLGDGYPAGTIEAYNSLSMYQKVA